MSSSVETAGAASSSTEPSTSSADPFKGNPIINVRSRDTVIDGEFKRGTLFEVPLPAAELSGYLASFINGMFLWKGLYIILYVLNS